MKSTLKGMAEKSLQAAPADKRVQFAKDLDKLISGDYVLVPKEPTQEMLDVAWECPPIQSGLTRRYAFEASLTVVYQNMLAASQLTEADYEN